MYNRNIKHDIKLVDRNSFVDLVFDIGLSYDNCYGTIMTAIEISDKYVDIKKTDYSTELAHVAIVVSAKFYEDMDYLSIREAAEIVDNGIVFSIEHEILDCIQFKIPENKFISLIGTILSNYNIKENKHKLLGKDFTYITKNICKDKTLLYMDPMTILIGLVILNKFSKTAIFQQKYKYDHFFDTIKKICKNFDIDIVDFSKQYIKILHSS